MGCIFFQNSYKIVFWGIFWTKMLIKSDFGCIFAKNSYKIVFWDVFWSKNHIKSYFGMYFSQKSLWNHISGCILAKNVYKIIFWDIFWPIKWPKIAKKAKKLPKRHFWQAKSAVERPFGHLTFLIFVKTAFFQFILIDFDKKRFLVIPHPLGWGC